MNEREKSKTHLLQKIYAKVLKEMHSQNILPCHKNITEIIISFDRFLQQIIFSSQIANFITRKLHQKPIWSSWPPILTKRLLNQKTMLEKPQKSQVRVFPDLHFWYPPFKAPFGLLSDWIVKKL